MPIIVVKELRKKVREVGKQINPSAIQVLDIRINKIIDEIIAKNNQKRITEANIQL